MLYLNTDFAGPQLRDVCEREGVTLLVHDQEFDRLMEGIEPATAGCTPGPTSRAKPTRSRR